MKVSVNWLRELVDVNVGLEELAHALTMGGLEVEAIEPLAPAFTGIVVAHVLSVAPHPNADKLRVTQVDAGTGETLTIVCGAPNVAAGQKVPCALPGAKLPAADGAAPFEVRKAKLRGVESGGMLCSARELGLSDDHAGLLVLEADAPVGKDIREHLALDDTFLTLKLTPNRGDCLSMFGIARDVAAITGGALHLPATASVRATIDAARPIALAEPRACALYFGRVIRSLDAGARTPAWMVRRLERAGLRPISPLVDITNYVMLERGQPMHAFDNTRLRGSIGVRFLKPGEKIQLLNEQWVEAREGLLAITDASGPVALGGIMGGRDSMVGTATTDVFLEAAYFDPEAIQGKARDLALTSDAAYRFERGVDYSATRDSIERATQLALEICGGSAGPLTQAQGELPARAPVRVRPARVRALLGYDIAATEMERILRRLGCEVSGEGETFGVTPPAWRFDLAIEEDFIEEIARIHGYDHVPSRAPRASVPMLALRDGARTRFDLRHAVADLGYQEVVNYSFVPGAWEADFSGNADPVRLANPIASTMAVMRSSLLGGLVASLVSNLNRGEETVRLFEIGRCFEGSAADVSVQPERLAALAYGSRLPEQWAEKAVSVEFFDLKGDLEALAGSQALEFVPVVHPALHPGQSARVRLDGRDIGILGVLHPRLQQKYELPLATVVFEVLTAPFLEGMPVRAAPVSRMPIVRRDLAVTVPESVPAGAILSRIRAHLPPVVREVEVFDQYHGKGVEPGRKSLAFRIVMQDTARTLTDSDVEAAVASIRKELETSFKAELRT